MGAIYRNVFYPAYHWVKRDGVNRALKELERNQWRTPSELADIQRIKLNELVRFASKNVPYYRELFKEVNLSTTTGIDMDDFRGIPPLSKDLIRREHDRLISEDLSNNGLIENSTSGSTGDPIRFYTDLRSVPYRKAAGIRSHSVSGWRLGDRTVSLWGAQVDEKRARAIRGWLHGRVTSSLFLSSFDLSTPKMDEYIRKIRAFRPVEFFAYPGPMEQFATHCRERNVTFPSVKGIVTSAETLWPHQREIIEASFQAPVFDQYGCREVSQIATECEFHDGLHISVDRLLIEVVDDNYQPCAPGEIGQILVTDLDNYGMPLIRYQIGDEGILADEQLCKCKRGLPRLQKVVGRTLDIIITRGGRRIGGTFWTLLLRSRPGFRMFQIVQEHLDGVTVNFVRDSGLNDGTIEYFRRKIQDYCGREFNVDFVERAVIEPTISGKRRIIVSHVSQVAGSGRDEGAPLSSDFGGDLGR